MPDCFKQKWLLMLVCAAPSLLRAGSIDSLLLLLAKSKTDSNRANLLVSISSAYLNSDNGKSLSYAEKAKELSESLSFEMGRARALVNIGLYHKYQGDFDKALECYRESEKIYLGKEAEKPLGRVYSLLGLIYDDKGEYNNALDYHLKGLKIAEKYNIRQELANEYNNIGHTYYLMGSYKLSLQYHFKCIGIRGEMKDKQGLSWSYNNIGLIYSDMGKFDSSLIFHKKSLELKQEINDRNGIEYSLMNIGVTLSAKAQGSGDKNLYDEAFYYYREALKLARVLGDKGGESECLLNIGAAHTDLGNFGPGLAYLDSALRLGKEIGYRLLVQECFRLLADACARAKQFEKAYGYHVEFMNMKDSIFNSEKSKQIAEMQTKYETEKKDLELSKKESELGRQKMFNYTIAIALAFMLVTALLLGRNVRAKKRSNMELSLKNRIIEEKNKDITDSINYAQRIQEALLPSRENIKAAFPQSFILFRPKDIVSGDFYFYSETEQNGITYSIIAAADCTGHGVPGAFMSMIGTSLLNQIIREKKAVKPAEILNHLHEGICTSLKQDGAQATRDGMDIALGCFYQKNGTLTLEFAGGQRPLYLVRGKELVEYRGDKFPIGGMQSGEKRSFTNHSLSLAAGDTLYLFSDGYADQFGGTDGKKFMTKNFKELLLSLQDKNMNEQARMIEEKHLQWKGGREQIDDILVIGIRV